MGLGKTLQILAFILTQHQKEAGSTSLLVVPTSLLFNWEHEIERFTPSLKFCIHHGPARPSNAKQFNAFDLIITTYGTLVSDVEFLKDFSFRSILDRKSTRLNSSH